MNDSDKWAPPLCGIPITNPIRHFLWYVCPLTETPRRAGISVFDWQAPWLKSALDKCSGRRICCIAAPSADDDVADFDGSPELVGRYRDLGFTEFLSVPNSRAQQEGPALVRMLSMLEEGHTPNDLVFFGHAKGVTRPKEAKAIRIWTEAMLEVVANCPDSRLVKALTQYGCAGAFRRHGEFARPGNHAWHYSGSYYWVRAVDVFRRRWKYLHSFFASVEAWPGYQFSAAQAACFLGERCDDPYQLKTWNNSILPELSRFRAGQSVGPYSRVWR